MNETARLTMSASNFRPYDEYQTYPETEMISRSKAFYELMRKRRSIRDFSSKNVPEEVIANAIKTAGTAPNGANKQPWHFCAIRSAGMKGKIREAAEKEEQEFYNRRAPDDWLADLAPLGTDAVKPFLETAPWLIAIFEERYGLDEDGNKSKHYYVKESVGIAAGMLITALHNAGLATLTHTPSPMNFLNGILERPENERPFLLLVTGYPADDVQVPEITKKPLEEIATFY